MKVWGLWHGGSSYAVPGYENLEEFSSLKDAKEQVWHREEGHDPYYPVVEESEMWVFYQKPQKGADLYPDLILKLGPRGGVQVQRG